MIYKLYLFVVWKPKPLLADSVYLIKMPVFVLFNDNKFYYNSCKKKKMLS